jgi:hypothetical protein
LKKLDLVFIYKMLYITYLMFWNIFGQLETPHKTVLSVNSSKIVNAVSWADVEVSEKASGSILNSVQRYFTKIVLRRSSVGQTFAIPNLEPAVVETRAPSAPAGELLTTTDIIDSCGDGFTDCHNMVNTQKWWITKLPAEVLITLGGEFLLTGTKLSLVLPVVSTGVEVKLEVCAILGVNSTVCVDGGNVDELGGPLVVLNLDLNISGEKFIVRAIESFSSNMVFWLWNLSLKGFSLSNKSSAVEGLELNASEFAVTSTSHFTGNTDYYQLLVNVTLNQSIDPNEISTLIIGIEQALNSRAISAFQVSEGKKTNRSSFKLLLEYPNLAEAYSARTYALSVKIGALVWFYTDISNVLITSATVISPYMDLSSRIIYSRYFILSLTLIVAAVGSIFLCAFLKSWCERNIFGLLTVDKIDIDLASCESYTSYIPPGKGKVICRTPWGPLREDEYLGQNGISHDHYACGYANPNSKGGTKRSSAISTGPSPSPLRTASTRCAELSNKRRNNHNTSDAKTVDSNRTRGNCFVKYQSSNLICQRLQSQITALASQITGAQLQKYLDKHDLQLERGKFIKFICSLGINVEDAGLLFTCYGESSVGKPRTVLIRKLLCTLSADYGGVLLKDQIQERVQLIKRYLSAFSGTRRYQSSNAINNSRVMKDCQQNEEVSIRACMNIGSSTRSVDTVVIHECPQVLSTFEHTSSKEEGSEARQNNGFRNQLVLQAPDLKPDFLQREDFRSRSQERNIQASQSADRFVIGMSKSKRLTTSSPKDIDSFLCRLTQTESGQIVANKTEKFSETSTIRPLTSPETENEIISIYRKYDPYMKNGASLDLSNDGGFGVSIQKEITKNAEIML